MEMHTYISIFASIPQRFLYPYMRTLHGYSHIISFSLPTKTLDISISPQQTSYLGASDLTVYVDQTQCVTHTHVYDGVLCIAPQADTGMAGS